MKYLWAAGLFALVPMAAFAQAVPAEPAAPGVAAATSVSAPWRPSVELFVGGRHGWQNGTTDAAFELDRGEIGLPMRHAGMSAEVRLEAVRSAPPQSLYGVSGNSLIVRIKRAWLAQQLMLGPVLVQGRGGMIGDPWVQGNARLYDLREHGSQLSEASGAFDSSELGLGARIGWQEHGFLDLSLGNGEGRGQVELNTGKNLTAVMAVRLWSAELSGTQSDIHLLAVGREGSQGVASVRSHRAGVAAVVRLPLLNAGGEWLQAWGMRDDGGLVAQGWAAWLHGHWRWAGIWARTDHWNPDSRLADAATAGWSGGVYGETHAGDFGRIRLGVAWKSTRTGSQAGPVPGQTGLSNDDAVYLRLAFRVGEQDP